MKNQKGITLIALVITIIVLLILAGVSISMVIGNNGILNQASTAARDTQNASETEQVEMAFIAARTRQLAGDNKAITTLLEEELNVFGLEKGEDKDYTLTVDGTKITLTFASGNKYDIENEIVTPTYSESGNAGGVTTPEQITIPDGLAVGDMISYYSNGSYKWEAQYASSDLATDGSADITLKTGTGSGTQDMSMTTWRVYSIDENTKEIEIVPASFEESNTVRLQGAQGYNNGVKLLNDACSALYSDSNKGITARSVNFEDFINYYDNDDKFMEYYKSQSQNIDHIGTKYDENYQWLSDISKVSYPVIYEQEELSTIKYYGETQNEKIETKIEKGQGLARSEQTELISRTYNGANNGTISTSASIRPYSTRMPMNAQEIGNFANGGHLLTRSAIRVLDRY